MAEPTDLTPMEWLVRLAPRIVAPERQHTIQTWRRYYNGDHDLPTGPSQISDAFRAFQRKARTNLCGLAVRSMADRMEIIGYRDSSGANEPMWALWNAARLPARQFTIWRKALSEGSAFVVVGPDPNRPGRPRVTIEGADRITVELDPADPTRRLAAARVWHDPILKRWLATVYLPGQGSGPGSRHPFISKTEAPAPMLAGATDGERAERETPSLRLNSDTWEARGPAERSTPDIPVIPFLNADEGSEPLAEFAGEGVDIQDRLNLSILNRLTTERFQAYRQRALVNFVPEEDPATGLPIPPFKPGSDQVWTVAPARAGDPEPKFVDLPPSDTANMLRACEADMRSFAAATTTPVYYLPGGDMINLAADAIVALDAGHNAKVKQRSGLWAGPVAEVWNLMAQVADVDTGGAPAAPEMIAWAPPQAFHPSAVADYVVKMTGAGVPLPMVVEEIGWSPTRVEQLRTEMASAALQAAALAARAAAAASSNSARTSPTPARPGAPAPGSAPARPAPARPPAGSA